MRASFTMFMFLAYLATTAFAGDPKSVTDYYRETGRDPSFQQRAADFNNLRPGEKYTGSAKQNGILNDTLRFGDQMAAQGEPKMGLFRSPTRSNKSSPFDHRQPTENATFHRPIVDDESRTPVDSAPLLADGEYEEGLQTDWGDLSGMIIGVATGRLGTMGKIGTSAQTLPSRIDSGRILHRNKTDPGPHHNFPGQLDKSIYEGAKQVKGPQYHLYTRPGTLNGKQGVYEIGVKPSATGKTESVMHRLFRPDKGSK